MPADNYDTGYDHGYFQTPSHVVAAGIGLPILDIVFVLLRFAARKKQRQPLRADDWLLVPATVLTLGIGISMAYGVSKRALAYPYVLPPDSPEDVLAAQSEQLSIEGGIQWAYTLLLPLALGCAKLSFLLLYKRIFVIDRFAKTNLFLVGMCVFIFLWMWGFFLTFLFMCRLDFWALWTTARAIIDHCIPDSQPNFAIAITDVISDVVIVAIPIPLIWRLNLSFGKKIGVTAVFLFGAITLAASLTRLILTSRILVVGYTDDVDPILLVTSFIYWGMVESGIAIFVACLPSLWIFSKGSSWTPLARVAKNFANSSIASLRLLRTKRSQRSMGTDIETLHENDLGKRSSSIRSESGTLITAQRAQYNDTNMAYTLSDINIQRA